MNIVSKRTLKEFYEVYKDSELPLKIWYADTLKKEWKTSQDIKIQYPNASFLSDNRVIFNIKGNTYRLITHIDYLRKIVRIKFIGTHDEYNKIDATKV